MYVPTSICPLITTPVLHLVTAGFHMEGVGADKTHLCQLIFKYHFSKPPLQTQKETEAAG